MRKSFSEVPAGVWAGAVVILLAAWVKDGWGLILGLIIIGATAATTSYRQRQEEAEAAAAAAASEPEDDGWGSAEWQAEQDKRED